MTTDPIALAVMAITSPRATGEGGNPVLLAAGDIAACDTDADAATAALIESIKGTVVTLGDNAYESGSTRQFANCYAPTWGRFKDRTRPAPGNHDYETNGAAAYFAYFGEAAGTPGEGWYSYDLGAWHVVVLNSNCDDVGGCDAGSVQERWLRSDLAAHPAPCTLAYWHHPRFSSGQHGNSEEMGAIWQTLYDAGADVVLSGHDHDYERFVAQDPKGSADPGRGIVEFVVGTGGRGLRDFDGKRPNSEVRDHNSYGVLKLTLHPTGYDWAFVPIPDHSFQDAGSAACHETTH